METKNTLPQVKMSVLIDVGIFIERFNFVYHVVRLMIGPKVISYFYATSLKFVRKES